MCVRVFKCSFTSYIFTLLFIIQFFFYFLLLFVFVWRLNAKEFSLLFGFFFIGLSCTKKKVEMHFSGMNYISAERERVGEICKAISLKCFGAWRCDDELVWSVLLVQEQCGFILAENIYLRLGGKVGLCKYYSKSSRIGLLYSSFRRRR